MHCSRCSSESFHKSGKMNGRQRYRCRDCGCNFTRPQGRGYFSKARRSRWSLGSARSIRSRCNRISNCNNSSNRPCASVPRKRRKPGPRHTSKPWSARRCNNSGTCRRPHSSSSNRSRNKRRSRRNQASGRSLPKKPRSFSSNSSSPGKLTPSPKRRLVRGGVSAPGGVILANENCH